MFSAVIILNGTAVSKCMFFLSVISVQRKMYLLVYADVCNKWNVTVCTCVTKVFTTLKKYVNPLMTCKETSVILVIMPV
jgi:hypothetical protein